jgi:phosphatidylglycerophosphatase C
MLVRWRGGWVGARHCSGGEKCRILAENGYGRVWAYAYTDSHDDAPLLAAAARGFIVNARPSVVRKLGVLGLSHVSQLRWG